MAIEQYWSHRSQKKLSLQVVVKNGVLDTIRKSGDMAVTLSDCLCDRASSKRIGD
jgi:hypothetical protein